LHSVVVIAPITIASTPTPATTVSSVVTISIAIVWRLIGYGEEREGCLQTLGFRERSNDRLESLGTAEPHLDCGDSGIVSGNDGRVYFRRWDLRLETKSDVRHGLLGGIRDTNHQRTRERSADRTQLPIPGDHGKAGRRKVCRQCQITVACHQSKPCNRWQQPEWSVSRGKHTRLYALCPIQGSNGTRKQKGRGSHPGMPEPRQSPDHSSGQVAND
jgi:hypothetical protein